MFLVIKVLIFNFLWDFIENPLQYACKMRCTKSTNGFRFEVYSFKSEINESRPRADTRVYGRIKYERLIVLLLADKDREMRG